MCMRTFVCANSVRSWRKTKTAREHYRTIFALIGQSKVSRQTFLMPNRRKSQLDVFRTQTWARFCAVALNLRKGSDLERKMLEVEAAGEPLAKQVSGAWDGYLRGTGTPYNSWAPVPESRWAKVAERACPASWSWFANPMWYLLEDADFTPGQLLECASVLPKCFRENLIYDLPMGARAALRLQDVHFHWLYQFAIPAGPWALGATACAMRRAELAGDGPTMRWAGGSLVWQLRQLADQLDPWVAEPLEKLRQKVLNGFAKEFYLDGLSMPIAPRDEERFGSQLREFIAWSETDPYVAETPWPPRMGC